MKASIGFRTQIPESLGELGQPGAGDRPERPAVLRSSRPVEWGCPWGRSRRVRSIGGCRRSPGRGASPSAASARRRRHARSPGATGSRPACPGRRPGRSRRRLGRHRGCRASGRPCSWRPRPSGRGSNVRPGPAGPSASKWSREPFSSIALAELARARTRPRIVIRRARCHPDRLDHRWLRDAPDGHRARSS